MGLMGSILVSDKARTNKKWTSSESYRAKHRELFGTVKTIEEILELVEDGDLITQSEYIRLKTEGYTKELETAKVTY